MNTQPKFVMGIPIAPQVTYAVSSFATPNPVTGAQIQKALQVCRDLALVYATADASNGGNQHIKWEALDSIVEMAERALGDDGYADVIVQARVENEFEPTDAAANDAQPEPLAGERKKADDTEGGACD